MVVNVRKRRKPKSYYTPVVLPVESNEYLHFPRIDIIFIHI